MTTEQSVDCSDYNMENYLVHLGNQVFSNELILEEISEHLDAADLMLFRLVCWNWYRNSNKSFRQKACVQLRKLEGTQDNLEKSGDISPEKVLLASLNDSLNNAGGSSSNNGGIRLVLEKLRLPFRKYALHNWDLSEGLNTQVEKFWELFGRHVKYLRVHKCSIVFKEFEFLQQIMGGILVPFMETLIVENCDYTWYPEIPKNINLSLKRLELSGPFPCNDWTFLKMFPNLEDLKVAKLSCSEDLLKNLYHLRRANPNILNLNRLDIMDNDQSLAVIPTNLPLKHLAFRICYRVRPDHTANILNSYAKSLETLSLFRTPHCIDSPFPNACLVGISFDKLVTLELWGNFVFDLNFLKGTPMLRRLRVDVNCYDKRDIVEYYYPSGMNTGRVCGKKKGLEFLPHLLLENADGIEVKSLREFVTDVKLEMGDWKKVKSWMPNLTRIEAPLNNKTLGVVCANWGKLRNLKLRFPSDVDDAGITGYADMEAVQTETRFPNLTDLNHLESFETQVRCGTGRLTNFSALMAFLKMSSLKNLVIYVANQMSDDMVEKLSDKIGHVQVLRNFWVGSDRSKDRQECCVWARYQYRFLTCHCDHCKRK